jgi:drug/metabolite transporter (DMT)-like permease
MSELTHALRTRCDWQVIASVRAALALLFTLLLARASGVKLVFWRPRTLWLRSIAGSMSLIGTFFALTRMPASDVLTLTNMFPIWVALLSWPLLGERPSARLWLSALSGITGVALIQQPHFAEGNFASLVALASSFFTSLAMIGLHRLAEIDPRAIVVHFSAVGLLFCLPTFFLFDLSFEARTIFATTNGLMLLIVGATATVGQIFLTRAFATGTPAKVSIVALTQVVFSMVIELVVWQRPFGLTTLLGFALVLIPTAWVLLRR